MISSPFILRSYECQQHQYIMSAVIFFPLKKTAPYAVNAYKLGIVTVHTTIV